jgi:hypothetical protein
MTKFLLVSWLGLTLPAFATTWNIRDYGATGNGITDDKQALQNVVNACSSGDTVLFPSGTYKITSTLTLKARCTYQGQNSPVLLGYTGTGSGGYLLAQVPSSVNNITITGLIFNGGGIYLVANDVMGHDITISNCTFENIQSAGSYTDGIVHTAIYLAGSQGWTRININHNIFSNITYAGTYLNCLPTDHQCNTDYEASNGIVIGRATDFELDDNTFTNVNQGIKIPQDPHFFVPRPGPFNILRNTFDQIHRMAIESQDGSPGFCITNLTVADNTIDSFVAPSWITMGISVPIWCIGDTTSSVRRNTINMTPSGPMPPTDGASFNYAIGIELGVPIMDSNIIRAASGAVGVAWFVSDFFTGSTPAAITNNTICGPSPNSGSPNIWWGKNQSQGPVPNPIMYNNNYGPTCSSAVPPPPGSSSGPVSDDFNDTALNTSLWQFVNPVGNGAQEVANGHLLLSVPQGSNHDPWVGGDNAVRVMQPISNSAFDIIVKFDSIPKAKYTHEGIIVEQDSNTFLRFEIYGNGSQVGLSAGNQVGGVQTVLADMPLSLSSSSVWLRVTRVGNNWSETWSTDGVTYRTGSTFSVALTAARIGPFAGNYNDVPNSAPFFTSSVDYFHNVASEE